MQKTTEQQAMTNYRDMIVKQCEDWTLDIKKSDELINRCISLDQFKKEIIKLIKEPNKKPSCTDNTVTIGKYSYPKAYPDFVKRSRRYREWMEDCTKKQCGKCLIYVVELSNKAEKFIKVGITKTSIKKRFEECPYEHRVLFTKLMNVTNAYIKEQVTLYVFQDHKYDPGIHFSGYTECIVSKLAKDVVTFVKMADKNIKVKCHLSKRVARKWNNNKKY